MSTDQALRTQLQERLAQLLQRVGKIQADLRSTHDSDWIERATERENDEVLEGLDEMSLAELKEIRTALSRLDNGQYGVCERCGQTISRERLAALPIAVTCARCGS